MFCENDFHAVCWDVKGDKSGKDIIVPNRIRDKDLNKGQIIKT